MTTAPRAAPGTVQNMHTPDAASWPAAELSEADSRDQLRAEALEQLMRMSADETHAYGLLVCADLEPSAVAVGRILAALDVSLMPGSPLLAYGAGTPLDLTWRRNYPPAERSLFAELLFCRELAGIEPGEEGEWDDAFAELEHLRDTIGVAHLG